MKKKSIILSAATMLIGLIVWAAVTPPAALAEPLRKAAPLTEVGLFDSASDQVDFFTIGGGVVDFLYFQAQRNVRLQGISFLGEPLNHVPGGSYFWVSLFATTADWQTPGGNGDRLFQAQIFFDDQGRVEYTTAVPNITLRKGAYYRLMLQVANANWAQPYSLNSDYSSPFLTANRQFRVFGSGNPALGPAVLRTPTWYLLVAPASGR